MRWRLSGTAWDKQKWSLAPALITLAGQVDTIHPTKHAADGTVASKGHDAGSPNSDHTVWPKTGSGIVYAIDIGETEPDVIDEMFEAIRLSADSRCKYAIHDKRMFSSYAAHGFDPFTWRPYKGSNGHPNHGHVSVHHTPSFSNDNSPWDIGDNDMHPPQNYAEFLNDHKFPFDEMPDWAVPRWEAYIKAGGSSMPESGSWPMFRGDAAWLYTKFIAPLEANIALLQKRQSDLAKALTKANDRIKALENAPPGGSTPTKPFTAVITPS